MSKHWSSNEVRRADSPRGSRHRSQLAWLGCAAAAGALVALAESMIAR